MTERKPSQGIALVTGAAKRIGRTIAYGLANAGWDVAIHFHRSAAEAETLQKEIALLGRRAIMLQADLAKAIEVQTLMPAIIKLLSMKRFSIKFIRNLISILLEVRPMLELFILMATSLVIL